MDRAPIPQPPGFAELSKAEQVRYLQELWDRIADRPGEPPVPESHLGLAEARLTAYRGNPSRCGSPHEVLDRLPKKPR